MLEELNGLRLVGTFAGDRLKKFHPRQRLQLDHAPDLDHEEILTLDNFLIGDNDSDFFDAPPELSDRPDEF